MVCVDLALYLAKYLSFRKICLISISWYLSLGPSNTVQYHQLYHYLDL